MTRTDPRSTRDELLELLGLGTDFTDAVTSSLKAERIQLVQKLLGGRDLVDEPPTILEGEALERALAQLPGWEADGQGLKRLYRFPSSHPTVAFLGFLLEMGQSVGYIPEWRATKNEVEVRVDLAGEGPNDLDQAIAAYLDGRYFS